MSKVKVTGVKKDYYCIRDEIAVNIMAGLVAGRKRIWCDVVKSREAYRIADAMLIARKEESKK